MEVKRIVQYHPAYVLKDLEALLEGTIINQQDGRIHRFTADFGNGVEMDINIIGATGDIIDHPVDLHKTCYVNCLLAVNNEVVDEQTEDGLIDHLFSFSFEDNVYEFILKIDRRLYGTKNNPAIG